METSTENDLGPNKEMTLKNRSILSALAALLIAVPSSAVLPVEQPLSDAASPARLVERSKRRPKAINPAPQSAVADVDTEAPQSSAAPDRDLSIIFAPAVVTAAGLVTPERQANADGCPVKIKNFGEGRYLANGLFTDFLLPTQKSLMLNLKALARSKKKMAAPAKAVLAEMKRGNVDAAYFQIYVTVSPEGIPTVDLIKRLFPLKFDAAPVVREKPEPIDAVAEEKMLTAPVKPVMPQAAPDVTTDYNPSDRASSPEKVDYAPEGIGPKWAPLAAAAPDYHAMPEPVAIGRDATATPNLTPEQRVAAREFGDGPLVAYAKALMGSGDLQSATEKVASAAQGTSLFINPGALTKAFLDLSSAVKWEGRPGREAFAAMDRNDRVAESMTAANRQLSMAGIYLAVAVPKIGAPRAEAYFLRGKRSVQVLGSDTAYDLRQISGPVGWYGFYLTKFDVTADVREGALAFGNQLSEYLASTIKTGDLISRPNGLANTVQAAWGIETLVRKNFGRRIPTGEEFSQMWVDSLLLRQGFTNYFRKNGGLEKANRMTNVQTALAVAEQAAFLYQIAKMDPRLVHVALCIMADRCFRLEPTNPVSMGARRVFDNFQTECGVQLIDASGKLRMEGLRDLVALDADRIQQMASESLAREIIRIYLPGTY